MKNNGCKCQACEVSKYYQDVRTSGYQLAITGPGQNGYRTKFIKDIDVFDYVNLSNEHFNANLDLENFQEM